MAASLSPAEQSGTPIEAFFWPTTRYRDRNHYFPSYISTEVEVLPGLTVENVLAADARHGGQLNELSRVSSCLHTRTPHMESSLVNSGVNRRYAFFIKTTSSQPDFRVADQK
jgi:hypothetical protein